MISKDTIDKIKSSIVINEVIGDYVNLKKKGINYNACCPFHNEKTSSFVVSPSKGIYTCFGCGESGDAIAFIQKHESVSYPDALKILGRKYGIEVEHQEATEADKLKYGHIDILKSVLNWAAGHFVSQITNEAAHAYILKRQLSKEIVAEFKIGYALPDWNSINKSAHIKGYSQQLLIDAGLVKKGDKREYDYFRDRIMLPFMDVSGNVIGFTGRDISNAKDTAKYLNSPDTDLFRKGSVLFGIYQAKKHIKDEGFVYLTEGNIDVVMFHQKMVKNTVCGSGTAFTVAQAALLRRFTDKVVVVYDGDKAGIKATFKNIDILIESGLTVMAIMLPEGDDPDSFARERTPEALKKYLSENEKDFFELKYELLSQDASPLEKANAAKEIINTISLIPDKILRTMYQNMAIDKLKIDRTLVEKTVREIAKAKIAKPEESPTQNGWIGIEIAEKTIQQNGEVFVTINLDKLIEFINDGTENVIYHIGNIEPIHIQALNKISQNVIIIDRIITTDLEQESKIIRLCKALFKARFNVKVLTHDAEERYESFLDYYTILCKEYIDQHVGDDLILKTKIEEAAELLSYADNTTISISIPFVARKFSIKEAAFNKILKPFLEKRTTKIKMANEGVVSEGEILQFDPERLPDYVDKTFFHRYGYFPAQNSKGKKVCYVFKTDNGGLCTVGNFFIEPLFHVYNIDPTKNKRIVQINNGEQNKQFYTELPSDSMIDFNLFKKCMWREGGNVFTKGKPIHFEMILASLANSFPLCFELNIFGEQPEGFFAFSNAIFSDGEIKYTDEFGLVNHDDKTYYCPAFSKIYSGQRKDDDKYEQDRFLVYKENTDTDFATWAELMNRVYCGNDNGKWAILMAIMSAFRSNIYPIDRLFTSLFFVGPTESGKTQIAISIRSLFMDPKAPLFNLNSGTDAAFFTMLERVRDIPVIFEEYNDYQISDAKFQGLKAAVYDGEGKTKRKDANSKELDVSKVNGAPILLGQESPERDDGSLGNRCVIKQVQKKADWTEEEVSAFQELKRREKNGLTNILIEILKIRPYVREHYARCQRQSFKDLKNVFREKGITVENRITNTVSLFTAMMKVLETYAPHLKMPFSYEEFFKLAVDQVIGQSEQILSTNRLSGFFESLEILMIREKIINGRDFKIEIGQKLTIMLNSKEAVEKTLPNATKLLFLRVNNIHSHYSDLKKGESLKLQNLMTYIKDHPSYIGHVKSTRFEWTEIKEIGDPLKSYTNRKAVLANSNTSAVVFNYDILKEHVNIDLEKIAPMLSDSEEVFGEKEVGSIPPFSNDTPF